MQSLRATGGTQPDLFEVRLALALLVDPDAGFQLQAAPRWESQSFRGDDLDGACTWVREHAGATGIYYCLNPVSPDLDHNVRVDDVWYRRWLLVDVDRFKTPDNAALSATPEEHQNALQLGRQIVNWLSGEWGWPEPIQVDSGNGFHALYRIDLANDNDSRKLIHSVLKALASHDCDWGTVGVECHDAKRVAKLPGTMARRGNPSPERPHTMAYILDVPETLQIVTREQLEALTTSEPSARLRPLRVTSGAPDVLTRAAAYLDRCQEAISGQRGHDRLFWAARAMVKGFKLSPLQALELLASRYNPRCQPEWSERELRHKVEEAARVPFDRPDGWLLEDDTEEPPRFNAQTNGTHHANGAGRRAAETQIWTLTDLLAQDFPPPSWAVPGLLSEGLSLLAGKPKLGKSWLSLNLALTIAAGGMALGTTRVIPGPVLYLSLEDRLRRVQDRARRVLRGLGVEASERLHIAVEWPRAHEGGLDLINTWLANNEGARLVIVDVWAKFRSLPKGGNRNAYDVDYEGISDLKKIIDAHRSSALLVHHCKKAKAEDALDEVSGTLGLAGAADGTIVLTKARSETEAELFLTGRDIEEQSLAVEYDTVNFVWKSLGKAAERTESKLKAGVLAFLRNNPCTPFSVPDIANHLAIEEDRRAYLRVVLSRLSDAGLVTRLGASKYRWPVEEAHEPL